MPVTPVETVPTAYFTILSSNYLPKAMALAESLATYHPGAQLKVLLIDALRDDQLPQIPLVEAYSMEFLGLGEPELLRLVMIYDLVEFATCIKPVAFKRFLETHENAVYLDPDTFLTSPMVELGPDLAATAGGILLTPHFLAPAPEGSTLDDGHLLLVGVYNLGFCAVDRRAGGFLDWWWGHLKNECLWEPMSGLFVDQKFCDIGSVLFQAGAWRHSGYNVSVGNIHERDLAIDDDGFVIANTGDRLRLFHFHAFDTSRPDELSTRFDHSTAHLRTDDVAELCRQYAEIVIKWEKTLPAAQPYPFNHDQRGREISRHLRRVHRLQAAAGMAIPSAFVAADAEAYESWRRNAFKPAMKALVGDGVKSLRLVLPIETTRFKKKFPKLAGRARGTVAGGGMWG